MLVYISQMSMFICSQLYSDLISVLRRIEFWQLCVYLPENSMKLLNYTMNRKLNAFHHKSSLLASALPSGDTEFLNISVQLLSTIAHQKQNESPIRFLTSTRLCHIFTTMCNDFPR